METKYGDKVEATRAKAREMQHELKRRASEMQESLQDLDQRARDFVQEHPFAAVGIAAVGGYVLARVAARLFR